MEFEKTIDLPSCGHLEGSRAQLQVTSMDMLAEKVVYTKRPATEKLLKIVSMCSDADYKELENFPFADLMYAFVRIRVQSSETSKYNFRTLCSMCDKPFPLTTDFDEMDVDFLSDAKEEGKKVEWDSPGVFTVPLPKAGRDLVLRTLLVREHLELEKLQNKRRSAGKVSDERFLMETLAKRTVSLGGERKSDPLLIRFFEKMKTFDGYAIKDALKDHDFGLDLAVEGTCPHCGEMDDYLVKMNATFFRPQRRGKG